MRTVGPCIDSKLENHNAIEITHDNNILAIRANNGTFCAIAETPLMGSDGESFCVNGETFAKVAGTLSGEVDITTDGKVCTVKGHGRVRLPIIETIVPPFEFAGGDTVVMKAEDFLKCYGHINYAIGTDGSTNRMVLTGTLIETDGRKMKMVALDGFRMAIDQADITEGKIRIVVPGTFMKMVSRGLTEDGYIKLMSNGTKLTVEAPGMMMSCSTLAGEYPDYKRILPTDFKTEILVGTAGMRDALKNGSVINNADKLVKLEIHENDIAVMNNAESADYYAEIPCVRNGECFGIAFNEKYLMQTIGAVESDEVTLHMNSPVSPVVVHGKDETAEHLILPVRTR